MSHLRSELVLPSLEHWADDWQPHVQDPLLPWAWEGLQSHAPTPANPVQKPQVEKWAPHWWATSQRCKRSPQLGIPLGTMMSPANPSHLEVLVLMSHF